MLPPIVFVDEQLIVVDKPSGLLTQPGRGPHLADSLLTRLAESFAGVSVVHRLDRDTSGLIVLARNPAAHRALSLQFETRAVTKRYEAVVAGCVDADAGLIELPLAKDFERPPRHRVDHEHGRPAETVWRVLARYANSTRLELAPRTGRSHQLRVHLQAIGHPILGDPLYGDEASLAAAERLLLHATRLEVRHPTSGAEMQWRSACPF